MDYKLWFMVVAFMKVGCDGVLDSDNVFDKCGVCGGDNTTCHMISGIFTRTHLRYGYNHVTRFPRGTCNINVTEMLPSSNYLALRVTHGPYIINGNRVLGMSSDYDAAGTKITYHRPHPGDIYGKREYIYIRGPTNSSLDLMVGVPKDTNDKMQPTLIKQTDNRGILYSYTIPMVSHNKQLNSRVDRRVEQRRHRHGHSRQHHQHHRAHNPQNEIETEINNRDRQYNNQTIASNYYKQHKRNNVQHDEIETRTRYMDYLRKLRQQRTETENKRVSHNQQNHINSNSSYNFGINPSANYYNRAPASASQTHSGYHGNDNSLDRRHGSGIPIIAGKNNRNGVPLKPQKQQNGVSKNGVPLALYNNEVVSPETGTGNRNTSNTRYRSNRDNIIRSNQGAYNNVDRYNYNRNNLNSRQVAQNSYRSSNSNSYYQQRPQVGINYGVQPGQPLQPNPIPDRNINQRYNYVNMNQRPLYMSSGYGAQQGVRGYRLANTRLNSYGRVQDGSIGDEGYYLRGNNVPSRLYSANAQYSWKISGFTECSRECGGGSQETLIVCVQTGGQTVVTDDNCDARIKPSVTTVSCNNVPCQPAWKLGEWSDCSTTCGRGTSSRSVECRQRMSPDIEITVAASRCKDRRPKRREICNENKPCVGWKIGEWGRCSAECGRGQRTREVICEAASGNPIPENKCNHRSKPPAVQICDMGSCAKTWFFTAWSEQCSSECGEGYLTREVYCSAEPEKCASIRRPDDKKPCKTDIPCGGKWFTGPWTKCSAVCGAGLIKRDVVCMKKSGHVMVVVGEENCVPGDKPQTSEPCDREPCTEQWYTTKWTQCSRTCDTGTQTREVKCLDAEQQQSTACSVEIKPPTRQSCNTVKCQQQIDGGVIPAGKLGSCSDTYGQCVLVVQARLCKYTYYKNICCYSCHSHHQHHHQQHHKNKRGRVTSEEEV